MYHLHNTDRGKIGKDSPPGQDDTHPDVPNISRNFGKIHLNLALGLDKSFCQYTNCQKGDFYEAPFINWSKTKILKYTPAVSFSAFRFLLKV